MTTLIDIITEEPASFDDLPELALSLVLRKLPTALDRLRFMQASSAVRRQICSGVSADPGVLGGLVVYMPGPEPRAHSMVTFTDRIFTGHLRRDGSHLIRVFPAEPSLTELFDFCGWLEGKARAFSSLILIPSVSSSSREIDDDSVACQVLETAFRAGFQGALTCVRSENSEVPLPFLHLWSSHAAQASSNTLVLTEHVKFKPPPLSLAFLTALSAPAGITVSLADLPNLRSLNLSLKRRHIDVSGLPSLPLEDLGITLEDPDSIVGTQMAHALLSTAPPSLRTLVADIEWDSRTPGPLTLDVLHRFEQLRFLRLQIGTIYIEGNTGEPLTGQLLQTTVCLPCLVSLELRVRFAFRFGRPDLVHVPFPFLVHFECPLLRHLSLECAIDSIQAQMMVVDFSEVASAGVRFPELAFLRLVADAPNASTLYDLYPEFPVAFFSEPDQLFAQLPGLLSLELVGDFVEVEEAVSLAAAPRLSKVASEATRQKLRRVVFSQSGSAFDEVERIVSEAQGPWRKGILMLQTNCETRL